MTDRFVLAVAVICAVAALFLSYMVDYQRRRLAAAEELAEFYERRYLACFTRCGQ